MSYFINTHPKQECGECRRCPASSHHRGKCADEMHAQDESDMMDEMERRWIESPEYLKQFEPEIIVQEEQI